MDKKLVFYKCEHCGNIAVKLYDTGVPLYCCGEEMVELAVDTDGAPEKHVPVVEVADDVMRVQVGEIEHPMIEEHYIVFIALETEHGCQVRQLHPGQKPQAGFVVDPADPAVRVYAYCNIHGLWVTEL